VKARKNPAFGTFGLKNLSQGTMSKTAIKYMHMAVHVFSTVLHTIQQDAINE